MTKPTIDGLSIIDAASLTDVTARIEAIKALLTEARIDQTVHLKAELLAKLPEPYRSPNELDPKAHRDPRAESISMGEKSMLAQITKIVNEL